MRVNRKLYALLNCIHPEGLKKPIWPVIFLLVQACSSNPEMPKIVVPPVVGNGLSFITTADRSSLLAPGENLDFTASTDGSNQLVVDSTLTYQTIDGFGYTMTGGSAMLLHTKLTAPDRQKLLQETFGTDAGGMGFSYLRISIGASDLDDRVFSYDDLSAGQTDESLSGFSLDPDRKHLIPVLKEILQINPSVRIMGSPWSAPAWMKSNGLPKGGSLKSVYYQAYANYFVKYIKGMEAEGINIDAVTLQNEPENPGNTPSMTMTSAEQALFVKSHLGPAFRSAGIKTKIIVFDHNCDHPIYPIEVLTDPAANEFIDGSAFHLYAGDISAMGTVHEVFPSKHVYFTEQWTSGQGDFGGDLRWHLKNVVIGATRNWGRTVLEWNFANDENFNPHTTDGGCTLCQGALTINNSTGMVTRNVSYYIIAHASRFVPPGSVRIGSNMVAGFPNVAFKTPAGKKVLIVLNDSDKNGDFTIRFGNRQATAFLRAGSVGTYIW